MAIDMCSDSLSLCTGPRISFSHDLHHTDVVPIEHYPYRSDSSLLDTNSEFNFCIGNSIENEPSSADELFLDGLIRPLQLHPKFVPSNHISLSNPQSSATLPPLPFPSTKENSKQEGSKQNKPASTIESVQKYQSFWPIKRSSSLHCDNSYKKSSFWSLSLLSRSNSTGSVPSSKQTLKDGRKQNSQGQPKNNVSSSSSSSSFYTYTLPQKPPLKKNYGGPFGNGVRTRPVLDVPPPYISMGAANLFGLGSFLRNGNNKKSNK